MFNKGILNPHILHLLARIRHTNTLVIADRGFPFWPQIETVDISLVDGIPTVLQVLDAFREGFSIGKAFMAEEFKSYNPSDALAAVELRLNKIPLQFEPHIVFKKRVAGAVGLIRTADVTPFANMILESA